MNPEHERIKWACRRGMLELDLFLVPFFEHCFIDLSDQEKSTFQTLLKETDPSLLSYLMGHQEASDLKWSQLIEKIRSFRLQRTLDSYF